MDCTPQTRMEKKQSKDNNKNPYNSKHVRKVEDLLNKKILLILNKTK